MQKGSARQMVMRFFALSITVASLIGIIAAQDWVIVVLTVISLIVSTYVGILNNKLAYKKRDESLQPYRKLSYINRIFYTNNWAAGIKTTNISEKLFKEYDQSYNQIYNVIKKYRWKVLLYQSLVYIQSFVLSIIVVMYLCYQIINGNISLGSFVGMITASNYLKDNLGQLFDFIQNSNQLSYYAQRLRQFEELESPIENGSYEQNCLAVSPEAFELEFKDVCFSYSNSNFMIKNMNFRIEKGQKIAIVGENGGGKTTLAKLILRLYDTQSGDILINGKSIKDYNVKKMRQCIGVAFQESLIYALSVRDNLSVYNQASDEELLKICDMFGLNHVFKKANATIDSQMTREFDNTGLLLSGGEMQKLSLARLFTGKFSLLILDEPSSALDPLAEYELNKLIFDKASTTTTIMISHRLSTVRDADCIYLINNGEILEKGSHANLMSQHGRYYEMFTKQAENYIKAAENNDKI